MITINGFKINQKHFPDNSLCLMDFPCDDYSLNNYQIFWKYENDGELFTLICCTKHIREVLNPDSNITLKLFYCPHARLDRVKSTQEVFTLKYFCEIINSLNFNHVFVLDPHSHVSEALLDRVVLNNDRLIDAITAAIEKSDCDLVYFPDDGALKRYGDLSPFKDFRKIYGQKNRDWKTGEIKGLSILSDDGDINELVAGANVLMVDDIISYGGTMYFSSLKLKELGAKEISAYVSHTENSILDAEKSKFLTLLNDGTVKNLYTTNSLFNGKHDKIKFV